MTNLSTYLFVDGGHLRKYYEEFANRWFGNEGKLDFSRIRDDFAPDKSFYFDCTDDEIKFRDLRKSNWRVELGYLSSGKKRTQKEVDTLIAVSMVRYAHIGKMDKAILLSGDGDFRPVVEELIRMDIDVQIVGDMKHTSQRLMGEAISVNSIDIEKYYSWSEESIKQSKSLDKITKRGLNDMGNISTNTVPIKKGKYLQEDVTLMKENETSYFLISQKPEFLFLVSDSVADLETYFELKYGKIDWN